MGQGRDSTSAMTISGVSRRTLSPYLGAAYEYEFDGTARATTGGYAIDAPTLRGGTGIGEAGLMWKPASHRGLYADLGVQGYTGTREGLTAHCKLDDGFRATA